MNKRLEALREGDQAITHALSELDTKLAAWVAAMERGQSAIALALEQSSAAVDDESVETEPLAPVDTVAEVVEVADSVVEPDVVEEADAVEEVEFEESASGMFQVPKQAHATSVGDETKTAGADSVADSEVDDETLLAQLDEETAKIIRVKRRLCNNQRSVRELLAEVQREEPPAKGQTQQRKQWWRLGNERQDG